MADGLFIPPALHMESAELRKKQKPAPLWMITFADLLSLLLTFFILIYVTSGFKQEEIKDGPNGSGNLAGSGKVAVSAAPPPIQSRSRDSLEYLSFVIKNKIAEERALAGASVKLEKQGLVILLERRNFDGGNAFALADLLSQVPNGVTFSVYGANLSDSLSEARKLAAELAGAGLDRKIRYFGRIGGNRIEALVELKPLSKGGF